MNGVENLYSRFQMLLVLFLKSYDGNNKKKKEPPGNIDDQVRIYVLRES